jgi:hypothetical protein
MKPFRIQCLSISYVGHIIDLVSNISPTIRHQGAEFGLRAWEFRPVPPYLCRYHGPGPRFFRRRCAIRSGRPGPVPPCASVAVCSHLLLIFSCAIVMSSSTFSAAVLDHAAAVRSTPPSFPLSSGNSCSPADADDSNGWRRDAGRALAHGATHRHSRYHCPLQGRAPSVHIHGCATSIRLFCEELRDSKRIYPCLSCDCLPSLFGIATVDNQISSGSILLIRELAVEFASHALFYQL